MKKIMMAVMVLSLAAFAAPAFADSHTGGQSDYQEGMKRDLVRGFKNVSGSPLEIPITIQEYHEGEGRPVIRHIAGLVDGTFQMVMRAGSGLWDFVAAFIPGHQEGMPVDPETLF